MKKIGVAVMAALLMAAVCGCEEGEPPLSTVSDTSVSQAETSVISKNKTDTVSVPSESIPFEEACAILDTCGAKETGLPQSMKDFQKYYFGTVQYYGKAYYSIYPYVESNDQKIFVGTNLLVSCSDGGLVLKKSWLGVYEEVPTGTAAEDLSWKEQYPDAKISPTDAVKVLAEKNLGLERPLSDYVFEFLEETETAQGIPCYMVTPKMELTNSTQLLKKMYLSADGSGAVFQAVSAGEYTQLA